MLGPDGELVESINVARLGYEESVMETPLRYSSLQGYEVYRYAGKHRLLVRNWDGVWDWAKTATANRNGGDSHSPDPTDWNGNTTWDDAERLLMYGWPEGVDKARDVADELRHDLEMEYDLVYTPTLRHDLSGGIVDVGRFLSGVPDSMMNLDPVEKVRPFVKIEVSGTCASFIKPEAIIRRGASIVALTDLLEDMNMRVELVVSYPFKMFYQATDLDVFTNLEYNIRVKRADEPLMIDAVMYMVSHPSALRRVCFSVMEQEDDEIKKRFDIQKYGHYGIVGDIMFPNSDILVPSFYAASADFNSDAGAAKWIAAVLSDQGFELAKKGARV